LGELPVAKHVPRIAMASVALVAITLPGCGLRADKQAVRAATEAAVGRGTGTATGTGTGTGTATGTGSGTDGADTSGTPGDPSNPASQSPGATTPSNSGGPQSPTANAPEGGNGGATDVGVTADSITVGNISDLGGPVPGLFLGGPYGTQAYFNYVNSQGGVYGRKLKLKSADDQLQCNQNQAAHENLIPQVFGFVGSWSLNDNCGAQILAKHPDVFNVSQALSIEAQRIPGNYNTNPYGEGAITGPPLYFKAKYPDKIKSVGTLVGNQAQAVAAWNYQRQTLESVGWQIKYENKFPPAQSNFTADVVRMKSQNIQIAIGTSINASGWANFVSESSQQGFKPVFVAGSAMYADGWMDQAGGAAATEGHWFFTATAMFLGEDASAVPEVGLFQKWMKQSYPNFKNDLFAATSWANAALFVDVLKKVGPRPTRKAVMAALAQTHFFNANGIMPGTDIASKQPGHCYYVLQALAVKFVKVDAPPTGFRCDGIFRPYQR
jgi:ABC-type branched-subunit amino acid transport system substrate-binding protein